MLEHVSHLVRHRVLVDRNGNAAQALHRRERGIEARAVVADDGHRSPRSSPSFLRPMAKARTSSRSRAQVQVCQMPKSLWRMAGRAAMLDRIAQQQLGHGVERHAGSGRRDIGSLHVPPTFRPTRGGPSVILLGPITLSDGSYLLDPGLTIRQHRPLPGCDRRPWPTFPSRAEVRSPTTCLRAHVVAGPTAFAVLQQAHKRRFVPAISGCNRPLLLLQLATLLPPQCFRGKGICSAPR